MERRSLLIRNHRDLCSQGVCPCDSLIQKKMNTFISLYYLIQSIILGIFIVHIYHSFIAGFDTLLLITDILVFVISLWILIRKSYNEILCFTIFLTFSIFVGLFEIPLLVLGNGAFIFLLLSIAQFVLNIYLSYKILGTKNHKK